MTRRDPRRWDGASLHGAYQEGDVDRPNPSPTGEECVTVVDVVLSLLRSPFER